jgi:glycosyltransferase involved in cell wall biosynthesis
MKMEKINVLHVADKLSTGESTIHGVTQLFAWWFPEYNHKRYNVSLCSLREKDRAGEFVESLGIRTHYLNRGKFDPRTLTDLWGLVMREDIQILHLHGYGAGTFGRLCALVLGIPVIIHEHMYDEYMPLYQRLADRALGKFTARGIAVSASVRDFMVRDRSIPENLVEVIYNGAPMKLFSRAGREESQSWKSRLGIPQDHLVVGIVGRLNKIKGHTYFLQAAKEVLDEFQPVTFLVVGDGELMEPLKELSRDLGIENRVVFMGYSDSVSSILKEVDVKVISSISEGIPLTLFEAMNAGCPVVSTDVGGIKEILEEGKTGFLTPPKDPIALAEKILILLKENTLRESMSAAAKEASRNYDVSRNVRKFEAIYEELISNGARKSLTMKKRSV